MITLPARGASDGLDCARNTVVIRLTDRSLCARLVRKGVMNEVKVCARNVAPPLASQCCLVYLK